MTTDDRATKLTNWISFFPSNGDVTEKIPRKAKRVEHMSGFLLSSNLYICAWPHLLITVFTLSVGFSHYFNQILQKLNFSIQL